MEPVVNEVAELDENIPKMLCQLDNHLGMNLNQANHISVKFITGIANK